MGKVNISSNPKKKFTVLNMRGGTVVGKTEVDNLSDMNIVHGLTNVGGVEQEKGRQYYEQKKQVHKSDRGQRPAPQSANREENSVSEGGVGDIEASGSDVQEDQQAERQNTEVSQGEGSVGGGGEASGGGAEQAPRESERPQGADSSDSGRDN